jgi:hypothetical protein
MLTAKNFKRLTEVVLSVDVMSCSIELFSNWINSNWCIDFFYMTSYVAKENRKKENFRHKAIYPVECNFILVLGTKLCCCCFFCCCFFLFVCFCFFFWLLFFFQCFLPNFLLHISYEKLCYFSKIFAPIQLCVHACYPDCALHFDLKLPASKERPNISTHGCETVCAHDEW